MQLLFQIRYDGMRYHNEFVKHKILDIVGDLFLLGGNVIGHYEGYRTGHMLNDQLLSAILSQPDAFSIETFEEADSQYNFIPKIGKTTFNKIINYYSLCHCSKSKSASNIVFYELNSLGIIENF